MYRVLTRRLASDGCVLGRQSTGGGSHRKWLNPKTQCAVDVPDNGKPIPKGTLRKIVRRLGLNWENYRDLR